MPMRFSLRILGTAALVAHIMSLSASDRISGQTPREQPRSGGHSRTLLPDGRELHVGGWRDGRPAGTIRIVDARAGTTTELPVQLRTPRAGHTATVLPDGSVLIFGGEGIGGSLNGVAELFDPASASVNTVGIEGASRRAHHTATVLPDGRVLVAGGRSATGDVLSTIEILDPSTGRVSLVDGTLPMGRSHHSAALTGDGRVRLSGGVDASGDPMTEWDVIYDLASGIVAPEARVAAPGASADPSEPVDAAAR